MNIKGKFVTLRAMQREDMPMVVEMFNDPELEKSVVGWAFPLSLEQQNRWFDNHMNDQTNFRFVIETPDDGAVGIATLTDIDWKNRNATHGIKLRSQECRGKGIGTDAVMAIMRYAFDELGLHRLNATRFEDNLASKSLYQKCGWAEEGRMKECVYKSGQWKNLICFGILSNNYYDMLQKNNYWDA